MLDQAFYFLKDVNNYFNVSFFFFYKKYGNLTI
jgi:hypothetical protein